MALVTNAIVYPQGPIRCGGATFVDTSEAEKTVFIADATDGSRLDVLCISTNDAADNTVVFNIYDELSALVYKWTVPIDDGSGITTTIIAPKLSTDALQAARCAAIDGSGVRHLYLEAGWILKAIPGTDLTGTDAIYVFCQGWDF
jgi:hypothetical protein